uniref:B5 domain-containing protein n=1 Tax=Acrobeloides nanus TaxID=290746 RepID=A0A914EQR8_9BILA
MSATDVCSAAIGDHSKIKLNTKNILIEVTATDLKKAKIVLDTLVTMFSQYCGDQYTVEPAEVVDVNGKVHEYPELKYLEILVNVETIVNKIGIPLSREQMMDLLIRMSLECHSMDDPNKIKVIIPPNRHDILHECDVAEDIALAYGYNNIKVKFPETTTVAQPLPLNKLTDQLRIKYNARKFFVNICFIEPFGK